MWRWPITFSRGGFLELDSGIAWSIKSLVHTFGLIWLAKLWWGRNILLNQCRFDRNIVHGRSIVTTTENVSKSCYFGVILTATMTAIVAILPALAILATAEASEDRPMAPQRMTPPARNPERAVEEEYQIARQRGTREALELFIARHPDSALAQKARADLQRISR
jgi:hypothetical protein